MIVIHDWAAFLLLIILLLLLVLVALGGGFYAGQTTSRRTRNQETPDAGGSLVAIQDEFIKPQSVAEREAEILTEKKERWDELTVHLRLIARLAAEGKPNKEIGKLMDDMSTHTVNSHLKTIYRQLRVHSKRELHNYLRDIGELNGKAPK